MNAGELLAYLRFLVALELAEGTTDRLIAKAFRRW